MSLFEKKTGNYTRVGDHLGKWVDNLVGPVTRHMGGDELNNSANGEEPLHPHLNLTTKEVVRDLENIVAGRWDRITSSWTRNRLREVDIDPDNLTTAVVRMTKRARIHLHNRLVAQLRESTLDRDVAGMSNMLLTGKDTDICLWLTSRNERIETTCGEVRAALHMPVEEFLGLPPAKKMKVCAQVTHRIQLKQQATTHNKEMLHQRSLLHRSLAVWAAGKLVVEHPNGSSLHHMIDYDASCTDGTFAKNLNEYSYQIIIVENDWGHAVPPTMMGEWHLPFERCCWEFRISGVRVLALTYCSNDTNHSSSLSLFYGRDGHWVSDDFFYTIGNGLMLRHYASEVKEPIEFKNVARLVHDCIRSACIMMDAQIVRHETVKVSKKMNERRVQENRSPLRDHYVVRLINRDRRAHASRGGGAGISTTDRSPQRGHWRIGTWVHYDDPDSGSEKYANDGGFIVSKSWRRWHFAGDPNNIIQKTYKV